MGCFSFCRRLRVLFGWLLGSSSFGWLLSFSLCRFLGTGNGCRCFGCVFTRSTADGYTRTLGPACSCCRRWKTLARTQINERICVTTTRGSVFAARVCIKSAYAAIERFHPRTRSRIVWIAVRDSSSWSPCFDEFGASCEW